VSTSVLRTVNNLAAVGRLQVAPESRGPAMSLGSCFDWLLRPERFPADLEHQYMTHNTEGVASRCLQHALSFSAVTVAIGVLFTPIMSGNYTLFSVTSKVQIVAAGVTAVMYFIMFAVHKQGGASSRWLRKYNDAAQSVPAIYICMVAPVCEPFRLLKLFGSTFSEEMAKFNEMRPDLLIVKEKCGGWVQDAEPDVKCSFVSYEALVMGIIIYVMASAAIFGPASPRWIFIAWHVSFAWYMFVRASLGDSNSLTYIFKLDACILYFTLGLLFLAGRRVDRLLRAQFLRKREMELRIDSLSRMCARASGGGGERKPLERSLSWPATISEMESYDSSSFGAEDRARRAESHQGPPVQTGDVIASLGSGSGPVFRPVRPGSKTQSSAGSLPSDDAKTQSSAGSLPFAWPRARPVETGGADRPACYPIAEITGRRPGTSMRKVIKQSISTCRRDAIARRPAGPLIGSGHRGHATSLPRKTLALPAADIGN